MKSKNRLPCIYVAQSATTRKFYVGQAKPGLTKRKSDHIRARFTKTDKFHSALLELGPDDFFWEVKFVIEDSSNLDAHQIKAILSEKEKFYIKKYNSIEDGYNTNRGGCGAYGKYKTYQEKLEASRKRHRERAKRPEERAKQKIYKQNHKDRILELQRKKRNTDEYRAKRRAKRATLSLEQKESKLAKRRAKRALRKDEYNAKRRARYALQREYIRKRHKTQIERRRKSNVPQE